VNHVTPGQTTPGTKGPLVEYLRALLEGQYALDEHATSRVPIQLAPLRSDFRIGGVNRNSHLAPDNLRAAVQRVTG